MNVLVIGGGAAGLTAACAAEKAGADVTLLEKNDRVGKKLLATGNGRCNLLNTGEPLYAHGRGLALRQLALRGEGDIRAFFDECGLLIAAAPEEDGRVYPACGQAAAVLDALRGRAERLGVRIRTGEECRRIERKRGGLEAVTAAGRLFADAAVLCCGSPAGGGSRSYALATALGHGLTPLTPALCPLECDMRACRSFKGLRVPAVLSLYADGRFVSRAGGECLFTETGISGICAMQLAADAAEALRRGPAGIRMDLSPLLNLSARTHFFSRTPSAPDGAAVLRFLEDRQRRLGADLLLRGALPRPMAEWIAKNRSTLRDKANTLCAWPFALTGTRAQNAQVMRGGIPVDEVDPDTLESRLVPGLYLCGEMLDVDGDCGGFNLMFAWASGLSAGQAAARGRREDPCPIAH